MKKPRCAAAYVFRLTLPPLGIDERSESIPF